jgi:hypothetical protein
MMHFQSLAYRVLVLVLAVCSTVGALFLAVFIGGPIVRWLFGIPPGFRDHFTSTQSLSQALFVQSIAVGVAFLLLGVVFAPRVVASRLSWALLAANPITVGAGFVLFKLSYQSLRLRVHDSEYYTIGTGGLLALTSPVVLAFCFVAGVHLSDRRKEKVGGSQST